MFGLGAIQIQMDFYSLHDCNGVRVLPLLLPYKVI